MEANNICPRTEKCPIFSGILKGTEYTETYKKLYCLNGEEGRNKCKRYLVFKIISKCLDNLLPNSSKSIEEIIELMKIKGEI